MTRLIDELRSIVGSRHVLTGPGATRRYATGYRVGSGPVAAVVRPASLVEQWRVLQACVRADHIVIVQAANTGLTGGSTPQGLYDRPVVIVSTTRIGGIHLLRGGEQVLCLSGTTLYELERLLAPLGREPHSVIGSSCLGASVVGGVCNNSGGALVSRGPAYTEYALYARIDDAGMPVLCNELGLDLPGDPEDALAAVEAGRFAEPADDGRRASSRDYEALVRSVDEPTAARYNADPARLHGASGCAGKVMVFAVRLDTFPAPAGTATFYIGTNDPAELTAIRRRMLTECNALPVSAEYIHREAFDLAERFGKDTFLAIRLLGTDRLPRLFALKAAIDRLAGRARLLPTNLSDRLMQGGSKLFRQHLPERMRAFRGRYEHHLLLKVPDAAIGYTSTLLEGMFPSAAGDAFECDPLEAEKAFLHRFAVAGAAVRYRTLHRRSVADIIALDVALRRNDPDWFEQLPDDIAGQLVGKIYYGHFFCHVFHQDYIVRAGADVPALEHRLHELLEARGAKYPAEHNVGHLYCAEPALADHYRQLDPCNQLNPGIGMTSRKRHWA